jgi:hypothetical protein
VTLDQITACGGSPNDGDPALIFAFNGASEGIPYIYYFDNFELIDTAPPPPDYLVPIQQRQPALHAHLDFHARGNLFRADLADAGAWQLHDHAGQWHRVGRQPDDDHGDDAGRQCRLPPRAATMSWSAGKRS